MGNRVSKVVTRTGDTGTSGLADGSRHPKTDARFVAMGDLDELNCQLGLLLALELPTRFAHALTTIQQRLFDIGGELAYPAHHALSDVQVEQLETWIETFNSELPPLKEFVLPGGGSLGAQAHLARAVARRAERSLWRAHEQAPCNPASLRYLNRLSDLLFVIARHLARAHGGEVLWQPIPRG